MICKKCNNDKDLEDFHKRKSSKTGYQIYCKTCSKIRCCMCNKQLQQPQPLICYSCAFKYS